MRLGYELTKLGDIAKEDQTKKKVEIDAMEAQLQDLEKYHAYVSEICKEERTKS